MSRSRSTAPADLAAVRGHRPDRRARLRRRLRPAPGPGAERGRRRPPAVALGRRHRDARAWPTRPRSRGTPARSDRRRLATSEAGSRPRTDSGRDGIDATDSAWSRRSCPTCRTRDLTSRRAGSPPSARSRRSTGCGARTARAWDELWRGRIVHRRSRSSLAGDHGCQRLLPAQLDPLGFAGEHVAVRARLLAELPLLPRPRDVGHRDVHACRRSCSWRPTRPTPCWTTASDT